MRITHFSVSFTSLEFHVRKGKCVNEQFVQAKNYQHPRNSYPLLCCPAANNFWTLINDTFIFFPKKVFQWDFKCCRGLPCKTTNHFYGGERCLSFQILFLSIRHATIGLHIVVQPNSLQSSELFHQSTSNPADASTPSTPSARSIPFFSTFKAPRAWLQACRSTFETVPPCGTLFVQMCEWFCQSVATVLSVTYFCWLRVQLPISGDIRVRSRSLPQSPHLTTFVWYHHRPTYCMGRGWHWWTAC